MRGFLKLKSGCAALGLLLAACTNAPATLSSPDRYARIGVLPAYEPEIVKRTPPGLFDNAVVEHLDVDFRLNELVAERVARSVGRTRKVVDLQSFATAYSGAPKVHSGVERKVFGDSRPLFTDVVRSAVGGQGLDAYIVIEGGPVRIYEPQVAPAFQLLAAQGHDLSVQMSIYVVDGRTFEVAAASHDNLVRKGVPDSWFVAPRQHANEIKEFVARLLDEKLEPALRKLGLI
jgi:hypothetical protein